MIEEKIGVHYFCVSENFSGQRIDNFLCTYFRTIPKSMIYRIIRTGKIRVNKKRIKFQYKLKIGDLLKIPEVRKIQSNRMFVVYDTTKLMLLKNSIIYEDDYLLVMNKPPGIAVHGGSNLPFNVIDVLRQFYPKTQFLELVHRLDRDTSGILLIAKNRFTLTSLHEQLRLQKIQKEYLGVVYGKWNVCINSVSKPLSKKINCYSKNINMVLIDPKNGKFANTYFQIVEHFSNIATLLIIKPITGRTHQIRVHAQYVSHPIIGDRVYGNYQINAQFRKLGLSRLFLHASSLYFIHPYTKNVLYIRAPIDQSFQDCLFFLRKLMVDDVDSLGSNESD